MKVISPEMEVKLNILSHSHEAIVHRFLGWMTNSINQHMREIVHYPHHNECMCLFER